MSILSAAALACTAATAPADITYTDLFTLGKPAGYSYAGTYRPRPAYRHTVENSVYIDDAMRGRGIGKALLVELIERCTRGPWQQMLAVIGNSANQGSIALHRSCGFRMVGTLERVGFKHGQWVDTVLMQRSL